MEKYFRRINKKMQRNKINIKFQDRLAVKIKIKISVINICLLE